MGKKGFTLVELMVVIVIIGVLAAVAIPRMMTATAKAKANEGPQILGAISRMQHARAAEVGTFVAVSTINSADDTRWNTELGMSKPTSKNFSFVVTATAPTNAAPTFLGTAMLIAPIGNQTSTSMGITINELDTRAFVGGATSAKLEELLPNWK